MSNFVEFKNGYRYIFQKIHKKGQGLKNEPVLVLMPIDKKRYFENQSNQNQKKYPTFVRSGVRSSGQLINISSGRLNEYSYFIIDKTRQLVMKQHTQNIWFAPYLITLPKGKDTFSNEYLDKKLEQVNPIIISKDFIEKEKKMIKPDNVFDLGIPLNSYIYFYVKNHLVGSNSTTTFTMGFESSALKNISKSLVTNNSYVEKYYPSISKIFNEMDGKQLSVIDLETYNKIINIFSKIPHLTGSNTNSLKNQMNNFQKDFINKDFIYKTIKQNDIRCYDWNKLLQNSPMYDKIEKLTVKYYQPDLVTYLDKEVSKEFTKELMDEVYKIISEIIYNKTNVYVSKEDVAKSANGYNYLIIVLNQLLK